jgi:hypothetical protein|tara:strand:+ start:172 stop:441 length:270 start_codon:yes stop_codon:yes gene_type:complete
VEKNNQDCLEAIEFALEGKWNSAHEIVQEIKTSNAQWIHAVLHKIEGDESNSRYWYSRCSLESYESYLDSTQELKAIKERLKKSLSFPK